MKRVLITGARGFLGRHCLPLLLERGYEVHAVSRLPHGRELFDNVAWHECDLLTPGAPASLLRTLRPEYLLHFAWYTVPGKFWNAPENRAWVCASRELMHAFAENGGARFVGTGSCAEYGRRGGECEETATPLLPDSLYGRSKVESQQHLELLSRQSGLSTAWGRIFFIYGPFEEPNRIVAYVSRCLLSGNAALCSNGTQILDFLHVSDVASAFVTLLGAGTTGPVNVGSGNPVCLREVLLEIGRQTGRSVLIQFGIRESPGTPERIWANINRLKNEVGWAPHLSLEEGIRQTLGWWKSFLEKAATGSHHAPT
jgi:nucleoside-diphosphate-sugar epimerase